MGELRFSLWVIPLVGCMYAANAHADATISVSLVPVGDTEVVAGTSVTLQVQATFNTRLSAAAFTLQATGGAQATLVARSANPLAPNGLTFVSLTSQDPFESGLPVDLSATSIIEVLYDDDIGDVPGGANDGLPPGSGVVLEELTIQMNGTGLVTVSLSDVAAVHTTGPPAGALFDSASIGVPSVAYTVTPPCGDADDDNDIDLHDWGIFQLCFTGTGNANKNPVCDVLDCDGDTDIDLDDYVIFLLFAGN